MIRQPPGAWEEPDAKAWLADCYRKLVGFYRSAAERRAGILVCMR